MNMYVLANAIKKTLLILGMKLLLQIKIMKQISELGGRLEKDHGARN